jgi:hypothetical protein
MQGVDDWLIQILYAWEDALIYYNIFNLHGKDAIMLTKLDVLAWEDAIIEYN